MWEIQIGSSSWRDGSGRIRERIRERIRGTNDRHDRSQADPTTS